MPFLSSLRRTLTADPRHGQILTLASLLTYGLGWLGFDLGLAQVAVTLASALAVQRVGDWWTGAPWRSGAKSALISALSLCLLLRTDALWLAAVASAIAVGSKFLIRVRGKHVFNPTNGALVALLLTTDLAWVSPGQWGTAAAFAFTMACAGMLVVNRAARSDVTLAFIAAYAALLVGRSLSLGEPLTIPLHRLESGAFLLFSFFMISDPKTTPDSRAGRIALRHPGGDRGLVRALQAVPPERLRVGAGGGLAARARDRLARPGGALPVAAGRHPFLSTRLEDSDAPQDRRVPVRRRARPRHLGARRGLLRLLRRQGRRLALQQGLAGGAGPRRRPHGDHHGQRLPRQPARVRHGHPGADLDHPRADPRRRVGARQASRRLHRAAPGRVLRLRSLRGLRPAAGHGDVGGGAGGGRRRAPGRARQEPGRDHRGAVHRRRVRHPHPVGGAELRPRDVAARERLPHPRRRHRGAGQLHRPEDALLRRQGEPGRAGPARRRHPAADPGGLRVAQVHAADPAGHGQRRRRPGALRLHADPQGPGREHQLPHGEAARPTSRFRPT